MSEEKGIKKITFELSDSELLKLEKMIKAGMGKLQEGLDQVQPSKDKLKEANKALGMYDGYMESGFKFLLQLVEGKHNKTKEDIKKIREMKEVEKLRLNGIKEVDEQFEGGSQ